MIFTIQTDDEVAWLDITNALSSAGIKHTIVSKQNDNAAQPTLAVDAASALPAEPDSGSNIVPAVESDTQPRP